MEALIIEIAAGLIFIGALIERERRMRRDLNGLGQRSQRDIGELNRKVSRMKDALKEIAPQEYSKWLIEFLKDI